ncbi:F-box only protein 48 isoform 1-T4 [Pholidichthys leucotaenia]
MARHLSVRPRVTGMRSSDSILLSKMHHDPCCSSPPLPEDEAVGLSPAAAAPPLHWNFAETLPTEMSIQIFGELDTASLCSAALTCRRWNQIIEGSERLWRQQCMMVRAVCQREVDRDRHHGLSWKVTVARNYSLSRVKHDWLRGRYSSVTSANELLGQRMVPLDVETWGEILQAELDR